MTTSPLTLVKGEAQLIEDDDTFKASFSRFAGDGCNGWSSEKQALRGKIGTIV